MARTPPSTRQCPGQSSKRLPEQLPLQERCPLSLLHTGESRVPAKIQSDGFALLWYHVLHDLNFIDRIFVDAHQPALFQVLRELVFLCVYVCLCQACLSPKQELSSLK